MNQQQLLAPMIIRFLFFILNFYFTVRITSTMGWNFLSVFLALFATRDFVHAVRLLLVYRQLNHKDK